MSLFRKMSIDALIASSEDPEKKLKRTLGPWSLTSLGIGAVIAGPVCLVLGLLLVRRSKQLPNPSGPGPD